MFSSRYRSQNFQLGFPKVNDFLESKYFVNKILLNQINFSDKIPVDASENVNRKMLNANNFLT